MLVRLLVDVLIFKYLSGFGADVQRGLIASLGCCGALLWHDAVTYLQDKPTQLGSFPIPGTS